MVVVVVADGTTAMVVRWQWWSIQWRYQRQTGYFNSCCSIKGSEQKANQINSGKNAVYWWRQQWHLSDDRVQRNRRVLCTDTNCGFRGGGTCCSGCSNSSNNNKKVQLPIQHLIFFSTGFRPSSGTQVYNNLTRF